MMTMMMFIVTMTLASLITHTICIDASINVRCSVINLSKTALSDLNINIPANCTGYDEVYISHNTMDKVNVDAFTQVTNPDTNLTFQHNLANNATFIVFEADFRETGIIRYTIHANQLKLGDSLKFHENTTEIRLTKNSITRLPSRLFDNLGRVRRINLNFNALTSLDSDTFHGLYKLRKLQLTKNNMKSLTPCIFNGLKLDFLNLSNNQLERITGEQFEFRDEGNGEILPTINLIGNPLTYLDQCLADLDNITYTHRTSLNITGSPDPPGTTAENICKNTRPDGKEPKPDWLYILFRVLMFLLLPTFGAIIWWIHKSVNAEVARIEVERDSARQKQSEFIEMKDLETRNEASQEAIDKAPATRTSKSKTTLQNNEGKSIKANRPGHSKQQILSRTDKKKETKTRSIKSTPPASKTVASRKSGGANFARPSKTSDSFKTVVQSKASKEKAPQTTSKTSKRHRIKYSKK